MEPVVKVVDQASRDWVGAQQYNCQSCWDAISQDLADWDAWQNAMPVWGSFKQSGEALDRGDYLNAGTLFVYGAAEVFSFGYATQYTMSAKAAMSLPKRQIVNVVDDGVKVAAKTGMTDAQLLTRAAQKAEAAVGGTGRFAGTLKHTYAKNLLSRYQSIYGDRGLSLGSNYFNNPAGRGFLDVVNHNTKMICNFKFGNAFMSNSQYLKYSNSFPGYGIQIIKP